MILADISTDIFFLNYRWGWQRTRKISEKIKQAVLAKLYDCNNDLSKQWFVYFSARHPETQKLQRIKIYEGFAKLATVAERKSYARKLIQETNEKLKTGWNPLAERHVIN